MKLFKFFLSAALVSVLVALVFGCRTSIETLVELPKENPPIEPLPPATRPPVLNKPTVSISEASVKEIFTTLLDQEIRFDIKYHNAIQVNLTEADIVLNKTGDVDGEVAILNSTSENATVIISGITGENGTLGITINPATATNEDGANEGFETSEVVPISLGEGYDIILAIGQSNVIAGRGIDPVLDAPDPDIFQLGRYDGDNMKIITAEEPLDHPHRLTNVIGFPLTFAKHYLQVIPSGRQVLIQPGALGGSSFQRNQWRVGDVLYNDAVARVNYILNNYRYSRLVAIIWHQGESDVGNIKYQNQLDAMITQMRKQIAGDQSKTPFILGGMVESWVAGVPARVAQQAIIADTVNRVPYTAYTSSVGLGVNGNGDTIHFSAAAQRVLGARYFNQLSNARSNTP